MSYRPAAQRRSFRTTLKKHTKRRKSVESSQFQLTQNLAGVEVDETQILSKTLATLERLGLQRFLTPPFSEHLDRWLRNLRFVLSEFELGYSQTLDEIYRKEIARILTNLQSSLQSLASQEKAESDLIEEARRKTSETREKLQLLEREYKAALKKLRAERQEAKRERDWLTLEQRRLSKIKIGLLSRILRRGKLEEREEKMQRIQLQDVQITRKEEDIDRLLTERKAEYQQAKAELSRRLADRTDYLESVLRGSRAVDALDIRSSACQEITQQIVSLVERRNQAEPSSLSPNDESRS